MDSKRVDWIDAVKGVAIFCVVMGHVIANFFPSWRDALDNTPTSMYWWTVIYSFHMPLLFFVSGYLFFSSRVTNGGDMLQTYFHKAKPLVVPFVMMGIVKYLIMNETDSYWYLRTLFFYITIWMIYLTIKRKFDIGLMMDISFVVIVQLLSVYFISGRLENNTTLNPIFDFPHFLNYWIYFSMGVLVRKYNITDKLMFNERFVTIISAISMIHMITLMIWKNKPFILETLLVMSIIFSIFVICRRCTKGRVVDCLKYMGRHTLEIYIIHIFFRINIPIIGEIIIKYCSMGGKFVAQGLALEMVLALLLSTLTIFMCAVIYEPLKCFPVWYECFLGRKVVLHDKTLQ